MLCGTQWGRWDVWSAGVPRLPSQFVHSFRRERVAGAGRLRSINGGTASDNNKMSDVTI